MADSVFLFQKNKLAVVFLFFIILRSLIFQVAVFRLVTQVFIGVVYCSFFASGDPVPLPTVLEEKSLAEPTIHSVNPVSEQLTYRIIDDGTIISWFSCSIKSPLKYYLSNTRHVIDLSGLFFKGRVISISFYHELTSSWHLNLFSRGG